MYCQKCGTLMKDNEIFCTECGTKAENVETITSRECEQDLCDRDRDGSHRDTITIEQNKQKICCPECGMEIEEDEKFCVRCGEVINREKVDVENNIIVTPLQTELCKAFQSNIITAFICKYAMVFAVYYIAYCFMVRVDELEKLQTILKVFSIPSFYLYYISLVALYAERKYLSFLLIIGARFINSIIILLNTSDRLSPIFRIIAILIAGVYVYKKFSTTDKCQKLKKSILIQTKYCTNCGGSVKTSDVFCPKCGNKM